MLSTVAQAAENWPRFRGPNGSGVSETAAPIKWSEKDYAWKIELGGTGHSSPVVWGENVFVTAADEDSGKRTLLCLNAADGSTRWTHQVDLKPFRKHGDNSYASSTPAVDDKYVYAQWTTQDEFSVIAITHDGKLAWRTELGSYATAHGGGGSPIVVGDVVIVQVDQDKPGSFITGLDRETGKQRWRTPRPSTKFCTSTPCLFRDQLVFATHASGVFALDPKTGHVLWELPGIFNDKRIVSSPVAAGELVFAGGGEGGRGDRTLAIRPPAAGGQPALAFELTQEMPYVPTPIAWQDRLFTWSDSGTITCHKAATGEVIWRDRVKAGFFASPICAAGKLYNISKRGEVFVVNAAGDRFELIAQNDLGEASHATPAVADGRIYLRTTTHLICIGKTAVATK
jgi:outer membrane protein assembly factor BamB